MQAKNTTIGRIFFNNLNLFKSLLLVGILVLSLGASTEEEITGNEKVGDVIVFRGLEYAIIESPITRRLWLDRNLGATEACIIPSNETCSATTDDNCSIPEDDDCEDCTSTTKACFGDLYQWGRSKDEHQSRTSSMGTTLRLSKTLIPPTGAFIIGSLQGEYDWTETDLMGTERSNTWSDRICPKGYMVPTEWEITIEESLHGSGRNVLSLPLAGKFAWNTGKLTRVGTWGYLWTKSVFGSGTLSSAFYFSDKETKLGLFYRSQGMSIRCVQGKH